MKNEISEIKSKLKKDDLVSAIQILESLDDLPRNVKDMLIAIQRKYSQLLKDEISGTVKRSQINRDKSIISKDILSFCWLLENQKSQEDDIEIPQNFTLSLARPLILDLILILGTFGIWFTTNASGPVKNSFQTIVAVAAFSGEKGEILAESITEEVRKGLTNKNDIYINWLKDPIKDKDSHIIKGLENKIKQGMIAYGAFDSYSDGESFFNCYIRLIDLKFEHDIIKGETPDEIRLLNQMSEPGNKIKFTIPDQSKLVSSLILGLVAYFGNDPQTADYYFNQIILDYNSIGEKEQEDIKELAYYAYAFKANNQMRSQSYKQAEKDYRKAIEIDSIQATQWDVHKNIALAQLIDRRIPEALANLLIYQSIGKNVTSWDMEVIRTLVRYEEYEEYGIDQLTLEILMSEVDSIVNHLNVVASSYGIDFQHLAKEKKISIPQMISVEAGSFKIGDKNNPYAFPIQKITLKKFLIASHEVTFDQYDAFCEATGRKKPKDNGWGRGDRPVMNVSWDNAKAYCRWLNKTMDLEGWRLPTEAEWEYAARGGDQHQLYAGTDRIDELSDYANFNSTITFPVKSFKPNALGLYDMSGNVWEWCEDQFRDNYEDIPLNGSPYLTNQERDRVIRGGGYDYSADDCRVTMRSSHSPETQVPYVGFRVVFSMDSPEF